MPVHCKRISAYCALLVWLCFFVCRAGAAENGDNAIEAVNEVKQIGLMDYVETIYDESNGMLTSEANTVLQDKRGYIWVGSYGGLIRYNGHEFQNMSSLRENAPKSGVRVLFQDSEDRIWIGTNDAGIYLFENETFRAVTDTAGEFSADAGALSVRSIAEGPDGVLYFGTTDGLFTVGSDLKLTLFEDSALDMETVENLMCDRSGAIWGSTGKSSVFVVKDGALVMMLDRSFFGIDLAYGLYQAQNGAIYIGTESSYVMRMRLDGDAYEPENISIDFLTLESKETVNDIYQDSEGKLWICTDSGIGYLGEDDTFYKINGLSSNMIMTQIYEDYEGNLWFASSRRGVVKLTKNKFRHIAYEADISGQTVNTTAMYNGRLYIGTDNGLKIMDESWFTVENDLTRALEGIRIRSMTTDSSGHLWISTYKQYGLMCYDDATGKWDSYTTKEGMPHDQVRMACELSNGDIAAATNGGVAILHDKKVVRCYTEEDGIQNEVILCLAEDAQHRLYAGSDGNGIYVIDRKKDEVTQNITVSDGLQSGVILRMVPDEAHACMWVSNGSEVAVMSDAGIQQVDSPEAGVGSVFDIKISGEDIWLLKSFGLIQINREDYLAGSQKFSVLTRRDGLTGSITANSWNDFSGDGTLYICTANGVYFININDIQRNTVPPRVSVGSIEMGDQVLYGVEELDIPRDVQRITFSLDLLSYGIEGGVLEYYLEGFDTEPIQIRNSFASHVNYTNLPGGNYVFHLSGYNADGTKSEELTFPVHKQQSVFERRYLYIWLAMAALLLAFLLIILAMYLNRRRIIHQQRMYEMMAEQTVGIVAMTIDAKDKYTDGHSHRVASYAREIGRRYGLSKEDLRRLYFAALLHDVGKIGVPDSILNKQGKLTDEEYERIKEHPSTGGDILKSFDKQMPWIPQVARYHHERYDGRGYNEGLKGTEIPVFARIVAVADAYDAMNSTRVYRAAMTEEKIRSELENGKNRQFDETFAQIMLDMISDHFEADSGGSQGQES